MRGSISESEAPDFLRRISGAFLLEGRGGGIYIFESMEMISRIVKTVVNGETYEITNDVGFSLKKKVRSGRSPLI